MATACFWQSCDCYFVREGLAETIFGQQCTAHACRSCILRPSACGVVGMYLSWCSWTTETVSEVVLLMPLLGWPDVELPIVLFSQFIHLRIARGTWQIDPSPTAGRIQEVLGPQLGGARGAAHAQPRVLGRNRPQRIDQKPQGDRRARCGECRSMLWVWSATRS